MVVVTGATGHIGNVLVRELLADGKKVKAIVAPGDDLESIEGLDVELVYADIRDADSLASAFDGAEYVYHLAGIISIGSSKSKLLWDVNVEGTKNVIDACLRAGVKRLLYVSSIHAFTEPPHGTPIIETKKFDPSSVVGQYAKSKAAATNAVLEAIEKRGLDAAIVHPTGVIGPYDYKLSNMGQMIVDYINGHLYAYIDGAYDFADVRDVARGIILASEKGQTGENYILSGEQITVRQILETLEDETKIPIPRIKLPLWVARATAPLAEFYYRLKKQPPLFTSYSISTLVSNSLTTYQKATRELGYTARPVRDSIRDAAHWFRANLPGVLKLTNGDFA
ncbi:MAG: SDR family oxidoreductase [Actinomycetota bacterium]|nr:SDR family oxidoreductase [Actinomycetota bacterium]